MSKTTEEKLQDSYLELLSKGVDKKDAANRLGVDLVMVRSWRMKKPAFNRACKSFTIGKRDSIEKLGSKEEFIALLEQGVSQREASRQLKISLPTIRTWKKQDADFKKLVLENRFK